MIFKKLAALISNTTARVMTKSTMVATTHALGWAIYADGKVEDNELAAAAKFAKNHPKLSQFGGEFNKQLDAVLNGFDDSVRMARVAAKRAIQDFSNSATNEEKEDLMIAVLDLFESDGNFDDDEKAVADEIAQILNYNWKDLM